MMDHADTLTKERLCEQIQMKLGFTAKEAKELVELVLEQVKG